MPPGVAAHEATLDTFAEAGHTGAARKRPHCGPTSHQTAPQTGNGQRPGVRRVPAPPPAGPDGRPGNAARRYTWKARILKSVNALEHIAGPVILVLLLGLAMRQHRRLTRDDRDTTAPAADHARVDERD